MRFLCLMVLLLVSGVMEAATESAQGPSCAATLPGAKAGAFGGYCYETVVANGGSETGPLPIVIGLHWSGSTPAEFREVLAGVKNPVRLVLIRGPNIRREGFSFYPVEPYYYDMDESAQRAAQLSESVRVAELARKVSREFQACGRVAVVGASQGGDLSYLLGLRHPDVVGLAIPLMATIDRTLIPDHPMRRIPIHAMHGVDDAIVPIETARGHAEAARAKGFEVALTEFAGIGHDVPPAMRIKVAAVIDAYLQGTGCW